MKVLSMILALIWTFILVQFLLGRYPSDLLVGLAIVNSIILFIPYWSFDKRSLKGK